MIERKRLIQALKEVMDETAKHLFTMPDIVEDRERLRKLSALFRSAANAIDEMLK